MLRQVLRDRIRRGSPTRCRSLRTARCTSARFSPDGKRIVVASQDGHARIYDAATHELLRDARSRRSLLDAAFEIAASYVVTAGARRHRSPVGLISGKHASLVPSRQLRCGASRSTHPVRVVATGGGRTVTLWRARTATRLATIRLAEARDGRAVRPSTGGDHRRRQRPHRSLYDTSDGRLVRELRPGWCRHECGLQRRGAAPRHDRCERDGAYLAPSRRQAPARAEGSSRRGARRRVQPRRSSRVATASADGTGRIWDVRTGMLVASLVGHKGIVDAVAFSPDGNFVVTGSRRSLGASVEGGQRRSSGLAVGHDDAVRTVAFSPDGSSVLTASDDGTARLWDPRSAAAARGRLARAWAGRWARRMPGPTRSSIAGPGRRVRLVRASDGRPMRTVGARGPVRAVAASADGKTLAVAV